MKHTRFAGHIHILRTVGFKKKENMLSHHADNHSHMKCLHTHVDVCVFRCSQYVLLHTHDRGAAHMYTSYTYIKKCTPFLRLCYLMIII